MRNKANSGRGQEMASPCWGKSYGVSAIRVAPAKQSQFRSAGRLAQGRWYKQSQLTGRPIAQNGPNIRRSLRFEV